MSRVRKHVVRTSFFALHAGPDSASRPVALIAVRARHFLHQHEPKQRLN